MKLWYNVRLGNIDKFEKTYSQEKGKPTTVAPFFITKCNNHF